MRLLQTAIVGKLNQQYGSEPLVFAEIEFSPGSPVTYCDRVLTGNTNIEPRIISIGSLDTTALATLSSDSQSVDLTLDDTDGVLKAIIDAQDISLARVRFSLGFQGLPFSERALLMDGLIHSPITYNDLSKTLALTVLTRNPDTEVGFSMDEGLFPNIPPDQRDQRWPLIFGDVCNVQTLELKPLLKGILGEPLGAMDPTLNERLCQAQKLQCPVGIKPEFQDEINQVTLERDVALANLKASLAAAGKGLIVIQLNSIQGGGTRLGMSSDAALDALCLERTVFANTRTKPDCVTGQQQLLDLVKDAQEKIDAVIAKGLAVQRSCIDARHSQICAILTSIDQQKAFAKSSVNIIGGSKFPQNTPIVLRMGEVRYNGTMSGETFNITGVTHPDSSNIQNPPCITITPGFEFVGSVSSTSIPVTTAGCTELPELVDTVTGPGASWKYFQSFEAGNFIWFPSGTEVFLETSSKITHIVSLISGVIAQVCAYRQFGDTTFLTEVDPSEYVVGLVNYGDYQVAELTFDRALSDIPDEGWSDEIYVTFQSSIGPNPINVIKYLIETYTNLAFDVASFDAVESLLANYPTSFVVRDSVSVFELIKEVAYQSRCAVTVRDDTVFIRYLSAEPTSLRTLGSADILRDTFVVSTTPTEDIATKHNVTWRLSEAKIYSTQDTEESFTLRHNTNKFGLVPADKKYFTQNTFSTIEKSATFWMMREANSWKYVEFQVPLKHLDLDVYDCVTINYPGFPVTKGIIEGMAVDFDSMTISIKCWTPILAGTNVPYEFAWPATLPAQALFPGPNYTDVGALGFGKSVLPPVGHPLRAGFSSDAQTAATLGDKYPSDTGDVYPTNPCLSVQPSESQLSSDLEPVLAEFKTTDFSDFADNLDRSSTPPRVNVQSTDPGGGNGGASSERQRKKSDACVPFQSENCVWTVNVTYVLPDLIRGGCNSGPCTSDADVGYPCSGTVSGACFAFASSAEAESFRATKQAEAEANGCSARRGTYSVYLVSSVTQSKLSCPEPKVNGENGDSVFGGELSIFSSDSALSNQLSGGESAFKAEGPNAISIFNPA